MSLLWTWVCACGHIGYSIALGLLLLATIARHRFLALISNLPRSGGQKPVKNARWRRARGLDFCLVIVACSRPLLNGNVPSTNFLSSRSPSACLTNTLRRSLRIATRHTARYCIGRAVAKLSVTHSERLRTSEEACSSLKRFRTGYCEGHNDAP